MKDIYNDFKVPNFSLRKNKNNVFIEESTIERLEHIKKNSINLYNILSMKKGLYSYMDPNKQGMFTP